MHPYEDEQFIAQQRAREEAFTASNLDAPPSYDDAIEGRASEAGSKGKSGSSKQQHHSHDQPNAVAGPSSPGPSSQTEHKRGVFGRLKDKAIGTKEEREEQRRIKAEQAARAEEQARRARMRQLEEREAYMRAYGGYAPYHPSYPGYGPGARPATATGLGGDNTAALLLGGLAGGLLLGDVLGGGFGGGFF